MVQQIEHASWFGQFIDTAGVVRMSRQGPGFLSGVATKLANPPAIKDLALMLSLAAAYYFAGIWALKMQGLSPAVTAVWIPSGIAVAAFLLFGNRVWPAIFVSAQLVGISVAGFALTTTTIAIGDTFAAFAAAYLVKKHAHGANAFDTARDVFRFVVLACFPNAIISATVGIASFYLTGQVGWAQCGYKWLAWCVSDASGVLLVAPFLILLLGRVHHRFDRRELLEFICLMLGLFFVVLLAFGPLSPTLNKSDFVRAWMCIPFLIWAGFRFCQLEAAGLTLIVFGSAICGTLHGFGYFVTPDLNMSLLNLDVFIGVIGTMSLAVAAMVAERRGVEAKLLGIQCLLQGAVEGKSRDLATTIESLHLEALEHIETERALRASHERFRQLVNNLPAVFWLMDTIAERVLYISPAYETVWGRSCESLYADPHSWVDAVHPDDHELAISYFVRESMEDRFELEYRVVRPDGSVRWIWDRGFVIRDDMGRICRLAGFASDITEKRHDSQARLRTQRQELQES